jgi:hypothetical protein
MGIAHREIFPGDPAKALGGAHMLVIAGAAAPRFQARETAEQGRAAFGMRFGREGIADGPRRIEPEQPEKGIIAIGQAAGGVAAKNRIALGIDQALVTRLALVEAGIDGGGILQRGFQPSGDGLELGGLAPQHFAAFARGQDGVEQEGQRHGQQGAEQRGRDYGELPGKDDIGQAGHQQGAGRTAKNDPNDP